MKFLLTKYSCAFFLLFVLLALIMPAKKSAFFDTSQPTAKERKNSNAQPRADFANLPLSFEANTGQSDQQVRFLSRNRGYNLFLTEKEAVLNLTPANNASLEKKLSVKKPVAQSPVIRIKPEGTNAGAIIEGLEPLETKSNYLVGRDSQHWQTNVTNYAKVAYRNIYMGIDLIYYGNQQQIEYDFKLAPGADASRIRLDISGAKSLKIADNGDLLIDTVSGLLRQHAPKAYQDIEGTRQKVASRYVLSGKGKIGFALGQYDRSKALVIDPVLSYATLLGGVGLGGDWGNAIAVDGSGNIYVTGYTTAANFPKTSGAFQQTFSGGNTTPAYDAFLTKLNPSGTGIVYSTYIGGNGSDVGDAIAVDASGNAYVSGSTYSTNFPVTSGAYQSVCGGRNDAFVIKLNATGTAPLYATYLGGSHAEGFGGGLAIDAAGNAYVGARTYSNNFPTTPGAFQTSLNRGVFCNECPDGFITKLNPTGTGLVYSTFLGGGNNDYLEGLALGADGSLYVTGATQSTNFPTTPGALQQTKADTYNYYDLDAFVTRLSPNGNSALYSTYLGAIESDFANAIAVDASGNAFVTGRTQSAGFPTTAGTYQTVFNSSSAGDIFVTKLNSTGTSLLYGTFLGGEKDDGARAIAVDATGNAVIAGVTSSYNFPTSTNAFQRNYSGDNDAFVMQLNTTGTQILYSSLFGDKGADTANDVAIDSQARIYITGGTYSMQFPVTQGSAWNAGPGESDVFVVKINLNETGYRVSGQVTNNQGNPLVEVAVSVSGSLTHTVYTDENGFYVIDNLPAGANLTLSANRDLTSYLPASINLSNLSQNETVNFSGPSPLWISGRILNQSYGNTQTIALSGSANLTMQTDNDGRYYFKDLPAGGNYTVTPMAGFYSFTPASSSAENLQGDKVFNFTYAPPPSIEGKITDDNGNAISGQMVSLSGTTSMTVFTDYQGRYSFYQLPRGGNYTVTPQSGYYTFAPESSSFQNLNSNEVFNFTALRPLYIEGSIKDENGNGVYGITVTLSGSTQQTTTCDYLGRYYFYQLPRGGNYTVTPQPANNITFNPASQSITNMTSDQTLDFTALYPVVIYGQIKNTSGQGVGNVTVTLSGSATQSVQTDYSGNYWFLNLPRGGTYTVTPTDARYAFSPQSQTFENLTTNPTPDFTADLLPFIFGWVTNTQGEPIAGATITLSGTNSATTQTDTYGNYILEGLPRNGTYTVTATHASYNFTPPSETFVDMTLSQGVNFTGTRKPVTISGTVNATSGGAIAGVTLTLSGSQSATTQTDGNGNYSFTNVPYGGSYTVVPAKANYTFTPANATLNNLTANSTANFQGNFTGYTISGHIVDSEGNAFGGAGVVLSGSISASTQTDINGNYVFTSLTPGGNYTVTPVLAYFTFSPASRSFTNLSNFETADFTATRLNYSISGRITNSTNVALAGVTLTLTGTRSATTQTDSNGNYSFTGLPAGMDYSLVASKTTYTFLPTLRTFANLGPNQTADFTGTLQTYSISGRIVDAANVGQAGVTMMLTGGQSSSVQTDSTGNYSFAALSGGSDYTITPAKAGFTFSPQNFTAASLSSNQTANFVAARATYTISGRILDSGGNALSAVSVALSGAATATTQTDANGSYSFSALASEGNYTVTPTLTYFTFAPASKSFTNLLANQTGDFTGTRLTYAINGRITNSSGTGLAGVSVTLSGGQSASTQTDATGNYSFQSVSAGLNYTITPAKNHYNFSPVNGSITNLSGNQSVDFTATLLQHSITGTILSSVGSPLAGVTVALSGSQTGSVTTDSNGNYVFTGLAAGGNYVVSASKQFYVFNPTSLSFNDLSGNQPANFTGTLLTYSIIGRVMEGSTGIAGVVVSLSGGQTASVQTDAAGNYAFNGLPAGNSYTVTPSHPFFIFSPVFGSFPALGQNQTANFSATRVTYQVSGSVLNACGQAISGVTMTLLRSGGTAVTAQTNASGAYSFTGIQAGYNYSLTPALSGHTFNPTVTNIVALNSNQIANFTGTPPTTTVTVQPTVDAYVRGGSSASSNFGTTTQLITRLSTANNTYESYLTFDAGQICTASNVKLRLYGKLSATGNLGVSAYSVANTSWVETSINWNNKPVTGTLLATTTVTSTSNAWYEWDITQYVQNELSAGRRIISIALKGVTSSSNQVTLNSRQATSNKPELKIIKP
jgi:hypothetical protein